MLKTVTTLIAAILLCGTAQAHELGPINIEERSRGAEQVIHAEVEEAQSEFSINEFGDQLIITRARLKVKEQLKGQISETSPMISVEGGTIGDLTLAVSDQPELLRGDELVVFMKGQRNGERQLDQRDGIFKVNQGRVQRTGQQLKEFKNRIKLAK